MNSSRIRLYGIIEKSFFLKTPTSNLLHPKSLALIMASIPEKDHNRRENKPKNVTLCRFFNPFTQRGCREKKCQFLHITRREGRNIVFISRRVFSSDIDDIKVVPQNTCVSNGLSRPLPDAKLDDLPRKLDAEERSTEGHDIEKLDDRVSKSFTNANQHHEDIREDINALCNMIDDCEMTKP